MRGPHDIGGLPLGPVDPAPHDPSDWDRAVDGTFVALSAKGLTRADELRRVIETMGEAGQHLPYYERWCAALSRLVVEKGLLSQDEIDARVAAIRSRSSSPGA
jgi:hypothetical protein